MTISKRRLACSLLAVLGFALLVLLLSASDTAAGEKKQDNLTYTFKDTGDDEIMGIGDDYIEYEFEGKEDYDVKVTIMVKNIGDEPVNYTLYGYHKDDLSPNPNTEEEEKIEVKFTSREGELDPDRGVTITISIELSDELVVFDTHYELILHFRNDDVPKSRDMYVNMTVLPVYELDINDEKSDTKRTIRAGKRLDLSLTLKNYGNTEDSAQIKAEVDGENIIVTVTKPSTGVIENMVSDFFDEDKYYSISVKVETDDEVVNGKYYVQVTAISENDNSARSTEEYEIEVKGGEDPEDQTETLGEEEESPAWIMPLIILVVGGGGGGAAVLGLVLKKKEEEEWEDEEEEWDEEEFAPRRAPRPRPGPMPPPVAAPPAHVACPKCRTKFRVKNPKRPLTVKCPGCASPITLKARPGAPAGRPAPGAVPRPAPGPAAPAHVACPKCRTKFKVKNPKRPLTVKCPGCASPITLKAKPGAPAGRPAPGAAPRPAGGAAHIKCPGCTTRFKVSNPKRPLKVKCPSCQRVLTLK